MQMKLIEWGKITREEEEVIEEIVSKFVVITIALGEEKPEDSDLTSLSMDLKATHLSCPLRLHDLLEADDFDFIHDLMGITTNMNRETGMLDNCFLPRYHQ